MRRAATVAGLAAMAALCVIASFLSACRDEQSTVPSAAPGTTSPAVAASGSPVPAATDARVGSSAIYYADITDQAGVDFVHHSGASSERWMVETNGAGCAFLDYDQDGFLDLFFVQGGDLPGKPSTGDYCSKLWRNNGNHTFTDVTAAAKIDARGYGLGVACSDYDNDGDTDIYLCNFGKNQLWQNQGDGTFRDVTDAAHVDDPLWSSAAAFGDLDGDGELDLYVVDYVNMAMDAKPIRGIEHQGNEVCGIDKGGKRVLMYCHPDVYLGVPSTLYRNDGNGTFTDVSDASGIRDVSPHLNKPRDKKIQDRSKGLGIVMCDFDDDGDLDIFIANDSTENFLFLNQGNMHFLEAGDDRGIAYNGLGRTEACMGTDIADVDGDGDFDVITLNLAYETYTLWINQHGFFEDKTEQFHLAGPSYKMVGFGAKFLDFDNDGDQDLVTANGHVIDNIAEIDQGLTYAQPAQLYENVGKPQWFKLLGAAAGSYFGEDHVGRGLAAGDLDNDGDVDLLFSNNNGKAHLLENRGASERQWIGFDLQGTRSNRDAIGARVTVVAGGKSQVNEVRAAASYASSNDRRLLFGLGSTAQVDRVEIRWPSGQKQTLSQLATRRYHHLIEPAP
ncbi:MAG: CRTAC1 family protein [Planctomycetota bacterium]